MGAYIETKKGFVDHFIDLSADPKATLSRIQELVNWVPIAEYLDRRLKRGPAAAGQPPYPNLVLFKCLLLQFMYGLSDAALSEALGDRMSFMRFTGLSFESAKPDGSTICRFRQLLAAKKYDQKLLDMFNRQLEAKGFIVKQGVAVDATLISSSRRPRVVAPADTPQDRHEDPPSAPTAGDPSGPTGSQVPDTPPDRAAKRAISGDHEAAWLKKGRQFYYGYKAHAMTDLRGFILAGHVTAANVSDMTELGAVLGKVSLPATCLVTGDKGYASLKNRLLVWESGLADGIMAKAQRGQPLSVAARARNKMISFLRYVIERSFGSLKRNQGFVRARYLGCRKTEMEFHFQALAYNLKRALNAKPEEIHA